MTDPAPGPRRTRVSALLALAFLVWASRTVLPGDLVYAPLDRSWCLGLAHALEQRWRIGVDYVFTFGPLGCLSTGVHLPELFWIKVIAWEGFFQFLAAILLASAGLGIRSRVLGVAFFALLVLQPLDPDAHAFLTIAATFVALARPADRRPLLLAIAAFVLAGLALVKFTYAVAVLACVVAAVVLLGRDGGRRVAGAFLLGFLALLAGLWRLCGQSLSDVPAYVARSVQISSGYSEAMSLPGPPWTRTIAAAQIVLALAAIVLQAPGAIAACLFHATILWIAYKAGFVRAVDHTPTFFQFAATAPLLLGASGDAGESRARASAVSRLGCAALGLLGLAAASGSGIPARQSDPFRRVAAHARALFHPRRFREELEAGEAADRRRTDLPRTRQVVGSRTIDMFSYEQNLLLRNGLAWSPRPVFQGYACLGPGLQDLNARHLESDRAPELVLFSLETIDDRLPAMDDAGSLRVLARDFEPVLQEKGLLLLRRNPRPGSIDGTEPTFARDVGLGEWVDLRGGLDGRCHLLELDVRPSLAGTLRTALDAAPPVQIDLELDDGATFTARIVPGMMRSGAIVDPLLRTQKDWLAWCLAKPLPRPVRMRVRTQDPWMYEPSLGVRLVRADDLVPRPRPDLERTLLFSLFPTPPSAVFSSRPPARALFLGEEVLLLSASSEMSFDVAGARKLSGKFGARSAGRAGAPAVLRVVLARPGEPERVLLELRQPDAATEGKLASFSVEFDAGTGARLVLRSEAGASADASADASCWAMIGIE